MSATATMGQTGAKPQAAGGRDAKGRFAAGNKGGVGNPFARKVAQLRKALVNFVTEDDMKHIAFILKEKAMGGDLAASKLLFQYVLGKPTEAVDPDRLDVDEWETLRAHARPTEEMGEVMGRLPAHMACDLTKVVWPCRVAEGFGGPLLAGIRAMDERDARREASAKQQAGEGEEPPAGVKPAARRERPSGKRKGGGEPGGRPSPIGDNGDPGDWLRQMVQEAMARVQREEGQPSTDGDNGRSGA